MKEDQNVVAESSAADEVVVKLLQRVLPITTARRKPESILSEPIKGPERGLKNPPALRCRAAY